MEPFNGDFIQRHAYAAALYNDIYVIHVAGDVTGEAKGIEHVINRAEGLTEQIIYYNKSTSWFGKAVDYYRWSSIFKQAIRKYILENGKPDLVHVHIPFKAGLMAIRIKKKYGIPFIVTEHWTIYHSASQVKYEEQNALFKSILTRVVKQSDLLTPVSNDLGLLMNKLVTKKSFSVIENVANDQYFHFADTAKPGFSFRFIHVSNMAYQKNVEGIIECFAEFQQQYPATELVIAGHVSTTVKQLIDATGLLNTKIFLKGEINYSEVAVELQQADALLMFSRFENSPCTIIEALCCGLPVIATSVGGIPELIDESNGLLITSEDNAALSGAMENLRMNYALYNRKKIAEHARGRFSYTVIGKKMDTIYNSILTGLD